MLRTEKGGSYPIHVRRRGKGHKSPHPGQREGDLSPSTEKGEEKIVIKGAGPGQLNIASPKEGHLP